MIKQQEEEEEKEKNSTLIVSDFIFITIFRCAVDIDLFALVFVCSGVPRGCVWGVQLPLRNSEVFTKQSRIPCSVENTSVTT
jgi:hypothetical protein